MSARTALQHARHDLEDAQRRGHRAEERAHHAAQHAAAGWNHAGSQPVALPHHAGAHGEGGSRPWWDNGFVKQFDVTDPRKARDRATDVVAATWEKGYTKFRQRYTRVHGYWRGQGENRTWVKSYTRKLPNISGTDPFSHGPTAAKWERFGRYGNRLGIAATFGFAAWDQWQEDASDPNLTTTDRVGRAAGNAAWSGGVAATGAWAGGEVGMEAGAMIGTFICPGVGTVIGGAVGGIVGAVAGGAAGAWVAEEAGAVKDGFVHAGQAVANGVVDAGEGIVHGVEDLGSSVGDALDDLNPF